MSCGYESHNWGMSFGKRYCENELFVVSCPNHLLFPIYFPLRMIDVHLCGCASSSGSSPLSGQIKTIKDIISECPRNKRLFFSVMSSTSFSNLNSEFFSLGNKNEGDIPSFYLCLNFKCTWIFLYDDTTVYTITKKGTSIYEWFFFYVWFFHANLCWGKTFWKPSQKQKKTLIFWVIAI